MADPNKEKRDGKEKTGGVHLVLYERFGAEGKQLMYIYLFNLYILNSL